MRTIAVAKIDLSPAANPCGLGAWLKAWFASATQDSTLALQRPPPEMFTMEAWMVMFFIHALSSMIVALMCHAWHGFKAWISTGSRGVYVS